jgi:D-amino-acid dehydrogenase
MRVAVLGAGVVGISTAYDLVNEGVDVTVFDSGSSVASQASAANASLVTPGHAVVWNSPLAPLRYASTLFKPSAPVGFNPSVFMRSIPWVASFLRNSSPARSSAATTAITNLALASAQRIKKLLATSGYDINVGGRGVLYWHRSEKTLAHDVQHCQFLVSQGIDAKILDGQELVRLEPAFGRSATPPIGALHVRDDFTGDGHRMTEHLAGVVRGASNGSIVLSTTVDRLATTTDGVVVTTPDGSDRFDNVVVCLGSETGTFLNRHNVRLPIAPAKGYSITADVTDEALMPTIGGVDFSEFCAMTPLGNKMRVTAIARFEGHDTSFVPANFSTHRRAAERVFPGLIDWNSDLSEWAGLRPMSSDGKPTIGAVPGLPGVWVNAGHGYLGWTLSMASADIITKKLLGQPLPPDTSAFDYRW